MRDGVTLFRRLSLAGHKLTISPVVALWGVSGSSVKTRVSATHWTMTDLVPASLLVYWTMTDPVPAGLLVFNTGVLSQVPGFWKSKYMSSTSSGHLPPGLVMGANWVIHYKVVLSADGGNSLVLACEWSEILGYFFFALGKILSC